MDAVTGAFGYTGAAIARRLIAGGRRVRTLTGHPNRQSKFSSVIEIAPLDFANGDELRQSLSGIDTLYNTYWVRFPHGGQTFEGAVANSRALFEAARDAGVRRIVHISIANPSLDSPLGYFRGKAQVEEALRETSVSHAILRPTVVFGPGDILINNIAWFLRRFPVFAVPDVGEARLQPVFVEDVAKLAVCAAGSSENIIEDAVGPETFAFADLARLIARTVNSSARIIRMKPALLKPILWALGKLTGDVVLTGEEIAGLAANLLVSARPALGETPISDWLAANANKVGQNYASELRRHYR
ncbi:MAG TPA: NAD-dependent epimerase/dehydratase family protein [Candidatus Acidoferrales bacterium]|nr:NAD-dependent epimerase/dehydratase family protein [Candidatus Acidoferrales bacterium]